MFFANDQITSIIFLMIGSAFIQNTTHAVSLFKFFV